MVKKKKRTGLDVITSPITEDYSAAITGARKYALHDLQRLFKAWRAGDKAAGDEIVRAHLGLVMFFARRYERKYKSTVEDLVSHGHIGLMMAMRRYNPNKKVLFSTYAAIWVKTYVLRGVKELSSVVGSNEPYKNGFQLSYDTSLNEQQSSNQANGTSGEAERIDFLQDSHDMHAELEDREQHDILHNIVKKALHGDHRCVAEMRILSSRYTYSLEDVGHDGRMSRSMSRERVRQLEAQAIDRIKHARNIRATRLDKEMEVA